MRLENLHLENFCNFKCTEIDLATITAVTGENQAGKTTILKAVELLITGNIYNQLTGKSEDMLDYFGFYNETFTIKGTFCNGDGQFSISRKFTRQEQKNGFKVSQEISVSPLPEEFTGKKPGVNDLNKWIADTLGTVNFFSFQRFFTLSATKQFQVIAELLGKAGKLSYSAADFSNDLQNAVAEAGHNVGSDEWQTPYVLTTLSGLPLINNALSASENICKDSRDIVNGMKKTVRSLSEIQDEFKQVAESIQSLEAEKSALAIEKEQIEADLKGVETAQSTIANFTAHKADADAEIAELKKQVVETNQPDYAKEIKKAEGGLTQLSEEKKRIDATLVKLDGKCSELEEKESILEIKTKITAFNGELSEKILRPMLEKLHKHNYCPICERDFRDAEERSVAVTNIEAHERDSEALEKLKEIEKVKSDLLPLYEQRGKARERLNVIKENIHTLTAKLNDLKHRQEMHQSRETQLQKLQLRLSDYTNRIKEAQETLKKAGDYTVFSTRLIQLKTRLAEIDASLKDAYQLNGLLTAQEKAYEKYQVEQGKLQIGQAIHKIILRLKSELVTKAMSSLEATAKDAFAVLEGTENAKHRLSFRFQDDRQNDIFQVGLVPITPVSPIPEFVPYHKVNAAHQAKMLIALLSALPANGFRLILLDDMEKISSSFEEAFTDGLDTLLLKETNSRPLFDNIIFTSSREYPSLQTAKENGAWKAIKLS